MYGITASVVSLYFGILLASRNLAKKYRRQFSSAEIWAVSGYFFMWFTAFESLGLIRAAYNGRLLISGGIDWSLVSTTAYFSAVIGLFIWFMFRFGSKRIVKRYLNKHPIENGGV